MSIDIYIAEDDSDDQYLIRRALSSYNAPLNLHFFDSGEALLQALQSPSDRSLIFLDLNMPGMSGIECLHQLRKIDLYQTPPIIIFTTSEHELDIYRSYESGANIYLSKPAEFSELKLLLENVINFYFARCTAVGQT